MFQIGLMTKMIKTSIIKIMIKTSIIKIKNNDQLCALRCIAVGIAFLNKNKNSKLTYRRIRENQDRQCLELAQLISHDVDKPCNIKEIMAVETLLVDYQILIISYESDIEFITLVLIKKRESFYCTTKIIMTSSNHCLHFSIKKNFVLFV